MLIKDIQRVIIFSLFVSLIWAKSEEVCFPLRSSESTLDTPHFAQGRPGKIGPRGPPGVGEPGPPGIGEPGPPGNCTCNPTEIKQLQEEIQLQKSK